MSQQKISSLFYATMDRTLRESSWTPITPKSKHFTQKCSNSLKLSNWMFLEAWSISGNALSMPLQFGIQIRLLLIKLLTRSSLKSITLFARESDSTMMILTIFKNWEKSIWLSCTSISRISSREGKNLVIYLIAFQSIWARELLWKRFT